MILNWIIVGNIDLKSLGAILEKDVKIEKALDIPFFLKIMMINWYLSFYLALFVSLPPVKSVVFLEIIINIFFRFTFKLDFLCLLYS